MDGGPSFSGPRNITKFFISNLPEGCTPWELKCGLAGYGDISDTYVARKRDKDGNRFGFASFKDVRDKGEVLKSLRGVSLGGCKLKVNIARFALENGSGLGHPVGGNCRPNVVGGGAKPGGNVRMSSFRDFRSFRDVLGKGKEKEGGESSGAIQESGKQVVVPDRTNAMQELKGVAVVGRTVDLETLVDLDRLLRIAKVSYDNIQYLGGLSVLISFWEEPASRFFLEAKELWGPWFSKLSAWEGQSLHFEKVAWLRIIGLPLHLLEEDVIKSMGELYGKIMHVQSGFVEANDLSFVRVGVLTDVVERIKEVVSLKWKDRSYKILVEEELDVWIPDCLGRLSSVSSGTSSPLASSPVVNMEESVKDGGGVGEGGEVRKESVSANGDACAGGNPKDGGSNNLFSEVQFNWQPFLGACGGAGPDVHGDGTNGIVFFKANKKTKRRRKGGAREPSGSVLGSPVTGLESSDKGRPNKRNRAHMEEDSDPFSIDRILAQLNQKTDSQSTPSCVSGVNLNIPLDSSGIPVGEVSGTPTRISSSLPAEIQGGVGGLGPVEEGGEDSGGSSDQEKRYSGQRY
ncbi:putative RNA recognition motif domain, nucleotide-binding alpha-beta plait domain superfamily [Helianthus annuus]|uniref:RNA recognition motif domain, nucleotide-binding alpha-beta plait domain superfamily n=1 Tax=Helianthus annuus TaxID=4232 RepID=A0A9K3EFR4_HELAN|nr:putative RNA recognition motif domain, nucleotide-binding alpha-beta plait domain superfamily [Helianthus annuus]KAJ0496524.1 putative RNA recognition motif domain, nucleotide-binding alpha-beta plait domain superfamily [Helianthus annuus]